MIPISQHACRTTFANGINPWATLEQPEPKPKRPRAPAKPKTPKAPKLPRTAMPVPPYNVPTDASVLAAIRSGKTTLKQIYICLNSSPKRTAQVLTSLTVRGCIENTSDVTRKREFVWIKNPVRKATTRSKVLKLIEDNPGSTAPDMARSLRYPGLRKLLTDLVAKGEVRRKKIGDRFGYWRNS